MKKILVIIVSLISFLPIYAEGRMTFKGVEINGSVESVMNQLSAQGFEKVEENTTEMLEGFFGENAELAESILESILGPEVNENRGEMVGVFTGKKVTLNIIGTATSNTAMTIEVVYEPISQWSSLKNEYDQLSLMLADKYGAPKKDVCDVCDEYNPVHEISMDRGSVYKTYQTEEGKITISITGRSRIMISYTDAINLALHNRERAGDL